MGKTYNFLFFLNIIPALAQWSPWTGVWKGKMEFQPENKYGDVNAELHIKEIIKDSVYEWKLMYVFKGKEKKDERPYELRMLNRKTGEVEIDEKNSIKLNGKFLKDKFVFLFELEQVKILTQYTLQKNAIIMEHITFPQKSIESGGIILGSDTIPTVKSIPVMTRQVAVLRKN
jgi:hypothetical protein